LTNQSASLKAVVITGASTGIGRACALYLAKEGYWVFAGVRKQADADFLRQKASGPLTPVFIDVTDPETIADSLKTVIASVGQVGLAGLVNNAGIGRGGPLEYLPLADLQTQFEVNVIGQIAVTQAFLPLLRQARGRIINMSSISGRVAMPFVGPYSASKFALEALTDSLRVELRPWGIAVISIQPGVIATPIWDKSIAKADELLASFPAEVERLYGDKLAVIHKELQAAAQRGTPAETVAKVVAKALGADRPKTRYLVGPDAKLAAWLVWLLPDRLRDWLVAKQYARMA